MRILTTAFAVMQALCAVGRWYARALNTRPLLTQSATTGFVCGLGDWVAQRFIEKRQFDALRTIRMTAIGFFFTGPMLRGWFLSLDKVFGPTRNVKDAVKKLVLDQCVFAPSFSAVLLAIFSFSQGMNQAQVKKKFQQDYFNMMRGFYCLWPIAQLVNFYFVPLQFRVSYTNGVSLIWNSFVGYLANKPQQKDNSVKSG